MTIHIHTNYDPPPIPARQFDWRAWYDDDEGQGYGSGRTEQEAIDDLLNCRPPSCVDCDGKGGIIPGIECATCEGSGVRFRDDKLNPIFICRHFTYEGQPALEVR